MASVTAVLDVLAPPDAVWQLIGGFGSLPDWSPSVQSWEMGEGGRTRRLREPGGETIRERLVAFDDVAHTYGYVMEQGPFPLSGYQATLRVTRRGSGSTVEWTGQFTPNGITDVEAERIVLDVYNDGLAALETHFTSPESDQLSPPPAL